MNRLAFIALLAFAGCEGYVDPQLVENRTDGGIVAVQQALTTYCNLDEAAKVDYGFDTSTEVAVWQKHPSIQPFLALTPRDIFVQMWAYSASVGWWYATPDGYGPLAQIGTGNNIVAGWERCVPFFGCTPMPYTVPGFTTFEASQGFPRSIGTSVWNWYYYVCPNGNLSPHPIGGGNVFTTASLPYPAPSTPNSYATLPGVFNAPDLWNQIAIDCGMDHEWHNGDEYCNCRQVGHQDDSCYTWPGNGTCSASDCASACP